MNKGLSVSVLIGLLALVAMAAWAQGPWWESCPANPPTLTPWPIQPTYTAEAIPTCRPTATLAPNPSPTLYPTATPYPLQPSVTYVSLDGNDSNPGTESEPWLTIQKAADTLQAGDTVYIKAGTYNERVLPQNSGVPGSHITYTAYPGDTVTIDGTGITVSYLHGLFEVSGKSYIKVSGLGVINVRYEANGGCGILVNDSDHIVIENNYTYNTRQSGIHVMQSSNVVVDGNEVELACNGGGQEMITIRLTDGFEVKNNHVHDGADDPYGGEGIDAKQGCSNGKIYNNHVHHTVGKIGIYVDAWDQHNYNIDVYNNIVHDTGAGITVASEKQGPLDNIRIYNNVVYDNARGITVATSGIVPETGEYEVGYGGPMKGIWIINNTVFGNGYIGYSGSGGILASHDDVENIVIRNNICAQNKNYQIAVVVDPPGVDITVDHNLIDGDNAYPWSWHGMSWEAIDGDDSVVGDPMFVNPSEVDFHLRDGSPAIDNGSSVDAPDYDFEGNPRPRGLGYDVGAYESDWLESEKMGHQNRTHRMDVRR